MQGLLARTLPWLLAASAQAQCEVQSFTSSAATDLDAYGFAVALQADTAVVGAYLQDATTGSEAGRVHVWVEGPGGWSLVQELPGAAAGDQLGVSLDLDGDTLVAGARWDDGLAQNAGAVHVYRHDGQAYALQTVLRGSLSTASSGFGVGVALAGDVLFASTMSEDRLYVYERNGAGFWNEVAQVATLGGGFDVDGQRALVGDMWADSVALQAGQVRVLERSSNAWVETAVLTASDAAASDLFGAAVALEGDTAVVAARFADAGAADGGALYVFEHGPSGWVEVQKLVHPNPADGDWLAASLDLEGDLLFAGSDREDAGALNGGAVHVWERTPAGWVWKTELVSPSAAAHDWLGQRVSASGTRVLAGAFGDDHPSCAGVGTGCWAGSASLFELAPGPSALDLAGAPNALSVFAGGTHSLELRTCPPLPGQPYLVLGSASGTSPGLVLDGFSIELVFDAYTQGTLLLPQTAPYQGLQGVLDAGGAASASLSLPPGSPTSLAGLVLHHVALVLPNTPGLALQAVSGASALKLLP